MGRYLHVSRILLRTNLYFACIVSAFTPCVFSHNIITAAQSSTCYLDRCGCLHPAVQRGRVQRVLCSTWDDVPDNPSPPDRGSASADGWRNKGALLLVDGSTTQYVTVSASQVLILRPPQLPPDVFISELAGVSNVCAERSVQKSRR